jgi:hypothetical protein
VAQPKAIVEGIHFNGNGTLSSPFATVSINGTIRHSGGGLGVYTVNADCTGTLTFTGGPSFDIFVDASGEELWMIQTGPTVAPPAVFEGTAVRVSNPRSHRWTDGSTTKRRCQQLKLLFVVKPCSIFGIQRMNPSDQADAFRIKMLSIPAGDSNEDEETEGFAVAIETGELVYDAETAILTNTKNAESVRIMADGKFQLLPWSSVVPLPRGLPPASQNPTAIEGSLS